MLWSVGREVNGDREGNRALIKHHHSVKRNKGSGGEGQLGKK